MNCYVDLRAAVVQKTALLAASGEGGGGSLAASQVTIDLPVRQNLVQAGGYGNLFALGPSKLRAEEVHWSGEQWGVDT